MARAFAFLMQDDAEISDAAIFSDVSPRWPLRWSVAMRAQRAPALRARRSRTR
jgi:hypothetical protein